MSTQPAADQVLGPQNPFLEFHKDEIEQSIADRFERQVERCPDRIAVKTRSHELTYEALHQAANRVARAILARRGAGPEPVALLLEQSAAAAVAILGILKAGKAYVPLDQSYPTHRINYMLADSEAGLLLTNSMNYPFVAACCEGTRRVDVLNVDEIDTDVSGDSLDSHASPDSVAEIHYTSGSSGRPKGVAKAHRDVLHNIMNYTNSLHICAEDRLTMLNNLGFSPATSDIYCALLNGARLCPWDFRQEGLAGLADWVAAEQITIFHWVPTPFRHFIASLGDQEFPRVRLVILVGEPVRKSDVELFRGHFPEDCLLVNRLGSTECFTYRMYFAGKATPIPGKVVPVGYAVEDMHVSLLDETGRDVGFNVTGEIAVKSRYLALGYWRRPDLTDAAFLPDPTGGEERLYLTGDLGVMRTDGCLEYLGRKDFQLKIRGYRVEVSEIEGTVLEHPGVKEAVVAGREDRKGDMRLIAYVVLERWADTEASDLHRFVSERLPDYMVPASFVFLQAIPQTPSGKTDRSALPAPEVTEAGPVHSPSGARTQVEDTLVTIWSEVLGVAQIGVHDNFFELGGYSLHAARIVVRILDALRVELPLTSIFERSTIAELAETIEKARADRTAPASPRVTSVPRTHQNARRA